MKIQELLNSPEKWCKGYYARDINKQKTYLLDDTAVSWCLSGAIIKCYGQGSEHDRVYALVRSHIKNRLQRETTIISAWNDHPLTSFDDIRNVITELDI